jgi:hypothetical protein
VYVCVREREWVGKWVGEGWEGGRDRTVGMREQGGREAGRQGGTDTGRDGSREDRREGRGWAAGRTQGGRHVKGGGLVVQRREGGATSA